MKHQFGRAGPMGGACTVCGTPTSSGFDDCYCCSTVRAQLAMSLVPMATVGDYVVGDATHRLLRGYKDGPTSAHCNLRARAIARWVEDWLDGPLAESSGLGQWDVVTSVPSSHRTGESPAGSLANRVPRLAARYRSLLERGPAPTGHLQAARRGFQVMECVDVVWLSRQRVLVFDDSLTTGARAQSAAVALRRAGSTVAGILAVGRARRSSTRSHHQRFGLGDIRGAGTSAEEDGATRVG
jgi:predicted amidophosphoribosyltransferase